MGAWTADDLACAVAGRLSAGARRVCCALLEDDLYQTAGGGVWLDAEGQPRPVKRGIVAELEDLGVLGRDLRLTMLGERVGEWLR